MAHFLLSAEAAFSGAHTLPGVAVCERMHGHNWRVRVTVRIDEDALDRVGMGVDFRTIEDETKRAVAEFDHAYLNELEAFAGRLPTAENVARVVSERVARRLAVAAPAAAVAEVEVWEMPQYRVSYHPD
jgi:6-pyruvoyltetrahydropterin/6-carboxytetrahydropterin synthase